MKIAREELERHFGATDDDPIVFEASGSRPINGGKQIEFTHRVLLRSQRDALLEAFGEAWLAKYLSDAEADVRAFEAGCNGRIH